MSIDDTVKGIVENCFYHPHLKRFDVYLQELKSMTADLESIFKRIHGYSQRKQIKGPSSKLKSEKDTSSLRYKFNKWAPETIEDVAKLLELYEKNTDYEVLKPGFEKKTRDISSVERDWGYILLGDLALKITGSIDPSLAEDEIIVHEEEPWSGWIEILKEDSPLKKIEYRIKETLPEKLAHNDIKNEKIYDSNALRIVLAYEDDCKDVSDWVASGGLLNLPDFLEFSKEMNCLPIDVDEKEWLFRGRLKDYINNPKKGLVSGIPGKGYKAINSTVYYPAAEFKTPKVNHKAVSVEIQIVDTNMYERNKNHPEAAHPTFKEDRKIKISEKDPPFVLNTLRRYLALTKEPSYHHG